MDVPTFGESMFIGGCLIAIVMFIAWKAKKIIARKKYRDSLPERTHGGDLERDKQDSDADFSQ